MKGCKSYAKVYAIFLYAPDTTPLRRYGICLHEPKREPFRPQRYTSRIRRYGNPAIRELAKKNDCPVIDIFEFSEEHPEMLKDGDGLHPQNEQYKILAEGVYDLVKDMIKKP